MYKITLGRRKTFLFCRLTERKGMIANKNKSLKNKIRPVGIFSQVGWLNK